MRPKKWLVKGISTPLPEIINCTKQKLVKEKIKKYINVFCFMRIPACAGMTNGLSVKKWYQMIKLDGFCS